MEANYRFVLDQAKQLAGEGARILDYGCGSGQVVDFGRAEGLDITGADVFYSGSRSRQVVTDKGWLGQSIFEIDAHGKLPFPDEHFDLVVSNQVFEHVNDIAVALDEIRRVLKPGGSFLNIFPSVGVFREGHCGVPFTHWLSPYPRLQRRWLRAGRALGLGYFKDGKSNRRWARDFSHWVREYTCYRTMRTIKREHLKRFESLEWREPEYIAFRLELRGMPRLARAARSWFAPASRVFARRFGSMVMIAK